MSQTPPNLGSAWRDALVQSGGNLLPHGPGDAAVDDSKLVAPGWANDYGNAPAEYQALRHGCGVVDFSRRTLIEVTGSDRQSFVHNFCTAHVKKLQPGQGAEAFITNVQGKTLGLVVIFCRPSALVLETVANQSQLLLPHLDRYHITEDIVLTDRSGDWAQLLVAGPEAEERLTDLLNAPLPSGYLDHCETQALGFDLTVCRTGFISSPNFLLQTGSDHLVALWDQLCHGENPLARPVGNTAFDVARIEGCWPWFGIDASDRNLPQELDRNDRAISFVKGCYLGQETVARIDALGHVNQTLRGLVFAGVTAPTPGTELTHDGKPAARITSAVMSPVFQGPLALAYVRRGLNAPGTQLTNTELGTARVVALPAAGENGSA